MSCRYEKGKLVRATTRGNSEVGQDQTPFAHQQSTIPNTILEEGTFEVRGEVFIRHSKLEPLTKNKADSFAKNSASSIKNNRTVTAGLLNQKKPLNLDYLDVLFFDILAHNLKMDQVKWLSKHGFPTVDSCELTNVGDVKMLKDQIQHTFQKIQPLDIPFDGVVVKVHSWNLQQQLNTTAHHPNWAIAVKQKAPLFPTTIEKIIYQVGRSGVITPVASFTPVNIDGCEITRASLHNLDYLKALDVREGDFVRITKANDIIPQIVAIDYEKRSSASVSLDILQGLKDQNIEVVDEQKDILQWRAKNSQDILIQQVLHYSKILRIRGLGPVLAKQLVDKNLVQNIFDLYKLEPSDLLECVNVGVKTAKSICMNIQTTRTAEFQDWLVACGIPSIGLGVVKDSASSIPTIHELVHLSDATIQKITVTLGDGKAQKIQCWVQQNRHWIMHFQDFPFKHSISPEAGANSPLFGFFFVFTGQLQSFTRALAIEQIRLLGATQQAHLTTKTHYLVVGEKPSSNKVEKAKQLEKKILTEKQFMELLSAKQDEKPTSKLVVQLLLC